MAESFQALTLEAFDDRDENQCRSDKKGGEGHAVDAFGLGKDDEADQGPEQYDAGHLKF